MLKKIKVSDVRLGMFLHELCGHWIKHPFWKKAFMLDDPKDLFALQACGITEVWIDTSKGLDVGDDIPEAIEEETAKQDAAGSEKKVERRVALQEETQRAQKLNSKAKRTVAALFKDARTGSAMQLGEADALVDEISQSVSRNTSALSSLARLKSKDDHAYLHSVAVCALMIALGKQMGMEGDDLKKLGMAGLLHDVGKMAIPDEVLNKPGKLTEDEYKLIRTHPSRGWEILKADPNVDEKVLDVCLHHHERVDGMGYPDQLSGESIMLFARMAAVCDAYDDITSDSSYKKGLAPAEAVRKMAEMQDKQFDRIVFHAFVKTVGIYPTGTLVKLKSGRLAVVIDQTSKSLLTPIVKVFFSTKVNEPLAPELVDLSKVPDPIASVEVPATWKLDMKALAGI
jgi:putative nucleotidyltransferase with HDIG domain